jgi:hypothetical protein
VLVELALDRVDGRVLRVEALVPVGQLPRSFRSARFEQLQRGPEALKQVVAVDSLFPAVDGALLSQLREPHGPVVTPVTGRVRGRS